jgi:hypothetical protein
MKSRFEQCLYLATAVVTGVAPFVLDPVIAGLTLAALNVALALCAGLR